MSDSSDSDISDYIDEYENIRATFRVFKENADENVETLASEQEKSLSAEDSACGFEKLVPDEKKKFVVSLSSEESAEDKLKEEQNLKLRVSLSDLYPIHPKFAKSSEELSDMEISSSDSSDEEKNATAVSKKKKDIDYNIDDLETSFKLNISLKDLFPIRTAAEKKEEENKKEADIHPSSSIKKEDISTTSTLKIFSPEENTGAVKKTPSVLPKRTKRTLTGEKKSLDESEGANVISKEENNNSSAASMTDVSEIKQISWDESIFKDKNNEEPISSSDDADTSIASSKSEDTFNLSLLSISSLEESDNEGNITKNSSTKQDRFHFSFSKLKLPLKCKVSLLNLYSADLTNKDTRKLVPESEDTLNTSFMTISSLGESDNEDENTDIQSSLTQETMSTNLQPAISILEPSSTEKNEDNCKNGEDAFIVSNNTSECTDKPETLLKNEDSSSLSENNEDLSG